MPGLFVLLALVVALVTTSACLATRVVATGVAAFILAVLTGTFASHRNLLL